MKYPRFYCDVIKGNSVTLDDSEAHHLTAVMRLKTGEKVQLFDGKGMTATAAITKITKKQVELAVENIEKNQPLKTNRIIIASSVAKGERFEFLVTKCTELGADYIQPVIFERTVKQPKSSNWQQRIEKLALSAAKQSERNFLPQINSALSLPDAIAHLKNIYPNSTLLFGAPDSAKSVIDLNFNNTDVIAFIGPEGGLTADEETLLKNSGAIAVGLCDTILRVETAAIAFAATLAAKRFALPD